MKYESILFDLDGTLWDATSRCAVAWNTVAARHSIDFREITKQDVEAVCGLPYEDCIRNTFVGLPKAELEILLNEALKAEYDLINKDGGILYEGVAEGLKSLSKKHRLFIISNCQSGYIEIFLRLSGLEPLFTDIECWGNTQNPKSSNVRDVIQRNNIESGIFVGDTSGDEKAANDNNLPFIFMTYGFGHAQSPVLSFDHFTEFTNWVLA